ncbi:hypothetical protein OAV41_02235 [Planctomycetota bacterium]|nr:hypothetical protein [Planctomycetota bacterium]
MKFKRYSHCFALQILEHPAYHRVIEEIEEAIQGIQLPYWKNYLQSYEIPQQALNRMFEVELLKKDWDSQKEIGAYKPVKITTPEGKEIDLPEGIGDGDFHKVFETPGQYEDAKVGVETEFGNSASTFRDLWRFEKYKNADAVNIGVMIHLTGSMSARCDSGQATFEKTVHILNTFRHDFTIPLLVYGVYSEDGDEVYDLEQSAKREGFTDYKQIFNGKGAINRSRDLVSAERLSMRMPARIKKKK